MDFWSITANLFEGFGVTCLLFLLTLVFSLPLGLIVAFGSMSKFKPLSWLCRTFVWIIRGTPLMLQLFVVFYVPGMFGVQLFGRMENGRFIAALIAFVINYACYFSEIYRGGIQSIPRGQYEAAQVLGMTPKEIFFNVILMQVVKRILAPISNEVITLVKDTSLAKGHLGNRDLLRQLDALSQQRSYLAAVLYRRVLPDLRGRSHPSFPLVREEAGLL